MKILTAPHMERCIGCLLCLVEAGTVKSSVSLNNTLIRVIRKSSGFGAEVDETAVGGEAERVVKACPRNCLATAEI
ncbi:MAG: hypothetical protein M1352_01095 [Patescibacteria group bacterium]|nr:hypothetical protein [Patescibacteria group bacterium]